MAVGLDELHAAFQFASLGDDVVAYLNKETGEIYYHSDNAELDETPEEMDDEICLVVPTARDFRSREPLILEFIRECLPGDDDEARDCFRSRGRISPRQGFIGGPRRARKMARL
jgi:hypothetical protein